MRLKIRPEQPADIPWIRLVHEAAFPGPTEARLVDNLRYHRKASVSLVAESDGRVVGHILFSPVTLEGSDIPGLGLAPVAVLPDHRHRGVGSKLIREGLKNCRKTGCRFVVVIGEPNFYRRFGFRKASVRGLRNEYGVDDPFMVLELKPGAIPPAGGLVKYAPDFAESGSE